MPFSRGDITEYRITQDYTDASVLNGFAAAGGLWTFLGSIIALLFGRTIMQSITGTSARIILEGHRDNAVIYSIQARNLCRSSDFFIRPIKVKSEKGILENMATCNRTYRRKERTEGFYFSFAITSLI
jgi:hypothetical protein